MNRSLRVKLKRVAELADGAFQKKYVVKGTTFQVNDEDTVRDALQDAIDKLEAVPENQMTVEVDLKEHLAQLYHDMGLIHFNHAAADDAGGCFARGIGNLVAVKAVYAGRVSQDQFTKAAMQCAIKKTKCALFDWAQVLDNTSHEGGDVDRNLMDLSLNLYDQGTRTRSRHSTSMDCARSSARCATRRTACMKCDASASTRLSCALSAGSGRRRTRRHAITGASARRARPIWHRAQYAAWKCPTADGVTCLSRRSVLRCTQKLPRSTAAKEMSLTPTPRLEKAAQ